MKKGILLSFIAAVLIGLLVYALWYIDKRSELQSNSKDSFIPYNSALVVSVNPGVTLPDKLGTVFAADIEGFKGKLLYKTAFLLQDGNFISSTSRIVAVRPEGKDKLVTLFVMDNKDVLSGKEVVDFLKKQFGVADDRVRKYDRYKIYNLKSEEEELYYAAEEGMILLSDSELYIEDALKQFEQEMESKDKPSKYRDINKYFSARAGLNVFLNTSCFSDLLPMFFRLDHLFPRLDISACFKWGALDGELNASSISLNGFMDYAGLEKSYMKTLEGQRPGESDIFSILPLRAGSILSINLSDFKAYIAALENYRYNAGLIEGVRKRKQEYQKILGAEAETELKELLQGRFAMVNMDFNETLGQYDGLVVAELKSGGLCKAWMEKVIGNNARFTNQHPDSYCRKYDVDRDKSVTFYKAPAEDMASVFWGYIFDGIESRFMLVVDNYLILASSEKVMGDFLKDYMHRNFVKDAEWFKKTKENLSAKYNLAYFADINAVLPYYKYTAKSNWKEYLSAHLENFSAFSALAMQWSNEGGMLYNTLFLNMENIAAGKQPHMMWQTKLDANISMKPVPVINHVTGEREIFVQDDQNTVYLLNDAGRVLWKLPVDGKINSEVYQVDALKNNKLQYLFSTPAKLYLVDRNGQYVGRYPLAFRSDCQRGVSVFDYDRNKNYRIFAPCADRQVYLYDIKGNIINDWKSEKTDKNIMTRVYHYRIGDKDYIVYADPYRLYILDRKGRERVRVSTVFNLKENTELYLTQKDGKSVIAFVNAEGPVNLVDLQGNIQTVKCGAISLESRMNVADVSGTNSDELIFTDGRHLNVYDFSGRSVFSKELDVNNLDFPYVYRFSGGDVRVGLVDREQHQMILVDLKGTMTPGFPIQGDSPFSIIFAENGNFYLFAGADQGSLIKYKVQR